MNETLLSAQNKLRMGWKMDNLPNDINNNLWNVVKENCDLSFPEVAALQNEISSRLNYNKEKEKYGIYHRISYQFNFIFFIRLFRSK